MSECWNPRKIITNLTKEEFKEWCIENKENLQYYIDSLDDTTYGQFEKWIISQYDLRTWNTLIDSMGNPECKRPGRSLSYNHLVGKPKIGNVTKQEYIIDKVVLGSGAGISVADPIVTTDPVTGKKTTTINISAEGLADGNVSYDETVKSLLYKKDGVYTPITSLDLTNNKLDIPGNAPGTTQPLRLPYFFDKVADANKVTVTAHTIKLDNTSPKVDEQFTMDVESATTTKAGLMSAADKTKLDGLTPTTNKVDDVKVNGTSVVGADKVANIDLTPYAKQVDLTAEKTRAETEEAKKIDLLGDVPGWAPGTQPYRLPYFFETASDANKVTVTAKTITLDNNKTQGQASLEVQPATTTNAGLMAASDKVALGNKANEFTVDGTTIVMSVGRELSAQIPAAMRFKGSKDYVSEVLALTGMVEGDVWYAEKDDRTEPQATAPVVNALICYTGTEWVYAGSTEIDMSIYLTKTDAAGTYESLANKTSTISPASTDTQYPTAKAIYDYGNPMATAITGLQTSKQDALTTAQIAACNSGIDSTKVGTYDGYATTIAGKLDATKCTYQTTAPTAAITDGGVHIVYLTTEPTAKYDGYIYFIK